MDEQAIFLQAIEFENTDEQSAFLDQACGADTYLRRHLDELLAVRDRAGSFMEAPAVPNVASHRSEPLEKCGTQIGPYKLMEQIGEGGFGLVFVAEQRAPVRRRVALKLVKPGMDSKEIIARFEAERQALALMDHPNIARVLDAGTTDSGRPYFVMDLVRGTPITTFCDENQLSPIERLKLFLPICRAVQHAHQKGIIHRDLKPTNLLVTLHDGEPVPKVIDFGVAKALNQQLTQNTVYTRFAQMIGTPLYMSPEQAEMSGLDVDTRSDVYSLGVLLYELLTGSTPFDQKQLSEAALDEVRRIIREEEPPKPSTRLSQSGERLRGLAAQRRTEPTKLSKMIRGDLDWIVMKALDKDRNRRYETANGFASDIERYLRDEEVVARPPSTAYRLQKVLRRHKAVISTMALVMAALLLGTIVSISQAIRANKAAFESQQNEAVANDEKKRAEDSEAQLRLAEQEMRERLYASQMHQASEALATGHIRRMKNLMSQHIPASPELDQRSFEWDLLWKAGHTSRKWTGNLWSGTGSKWPFYDMAVSPDGKILAATDKGDATIHVFDSDNLNLICSPLQGGTPLDRLCFSHDGRHLVASDAQGDAVRIFDTKTWAHSKTLDRAGGRAMDCARNAPLMVTSRNKEIRLWNTTSWNVLRSLATHRENWSHYLALSPDGTKLADVVPTDDRTGPDQIDLWDLAQGKLVRTLPGRYLRDDADAIEFSPDGSLFAVADWEGVARIWSVAELFNNNLSGVDDEPETLQTLHASNPIRALAFSPDSTKAVITTTLRSAAFVPQAVQVWEIGSGERIAVFEEHAKAVTDVVFIDDNTIGTIAHDATLMTWNLTESRAFDVIHGVEWRSGVGYDLDGSVIYHDYAEGKIRRWDMALRESEPILDADNSYSRLAFSSNGRLLVAITQDERQLRVWDLEDESMLHSSSIDLDDLRRRIELAGGISKPRGNELGRDHDRAFISRLSVSNDGRLVAFVVPLVRDGGTAARVVLIDPKDGRPIVQAQQSVYASITPTFSPSGRQLVTSENAGVYSTLSDIHPDSMRPRLQILGSLPLSAAFSHDGTILAIANYYNEIRLHRATNGTLLQTLNDHAQWARSIVFSKGGRHLVSAGPDGRVLIWKRDIAKEYRLVCTLPGLSGLETMYATFAPSNDSLAVLHRSLAVSKQLKSDGLTPFHDGKIQVWRVARPEEARHGMDERLFRVGSTLERQQKLAELNEILAQVSDTRAHGMRARLYDELGNGISAAADWGSMLKHDADNLHLLESRARAYELAGQWSRI